MKAEDVAEELELLAADCTMQSFAERRLVKARAIRAVIEDRDDLQRTFNMTWAAQMRAITAWQERHDKPLTWPDHERLVLWLLEDRERLREALEIIAGRRQCIDNLIGDKEIARAALETKS